MVSLHEYWFGVCTLMPKEFQNLKTIYTLQKQNQLQDKQIKPLAKYLNLTMHQVSRHGEMLCEMDTKMFIMNKTIQDMMWSIDFL